MNPDVVSRFSGIARPLDFDYPGNRLIVSLSAAVFISGSILQWLGNRGGGEALIWGLEAAAAVFLAWALGRELDPDHHPAALMAAGLTAAVFWMWGRAELGLLLWMLIGTRILNRSAGIKPKWLDLAGFAGFGMWASFQGHWEAGLLTIIILILNGLLPEGQKENWFFAGVSAAGMAVLFILEGNVRLVGFFNCFAFGAALIGAALFLPVIIQSRSIQSRGDKTGERLGATRVQAAQLIAALFWVLHTGMEGTRGLLSLFSVYAAGLGSGLYWIFGLVTEQLRKSGQE